MNQRSDGAGMSVDSVLGRCGRSSVPLDAGCLDSAHALLHPLWWAALVLLVVNDHLFKASGLLPSVVTGKLSDVAGLVVAPAVLCGLLGLRRRLSCIAAYVAVAIVFAAINLVPSAARAWSEVFAAIGVPFRVWPDPTDLLALPALVVAYLVFARLRASGGSRSLWSSGAAKVGVLVGGVACVGSSPWPLAPPAVVQDRVVVESLGGAIFVLRAQDGELVRVLASAGTNDTVPPVYNGILYQVQSDGRITGICIDNPQEPFPIWKHSDSRAWLRILGVDEHRLYVSAEDGRIYGIGRVFGNVVWSLPADTMHVGELPVSDDTALVSDGSRVRAVSARDGKVFWDFRAKASVGPGLPYGERVYVASVDGVVHGLEWGSGRRVWRYRADSKSCEGGNPHVFAESGHVFSCFGHETHAIAVKDTRLRWKTKGSVVANASGVVVVRRSGDVLVGLAGETGKALWSRKFDGGLGSNPTASDSMLFVRDKPGKLYGLDLRTGTVRWIFE